MIFKAEPNLYVRISNKYVQRATGIKGFYFDDKGEYNTDKEILINLLKQNFEIENTEALTYKCKHCEFITDNKGSLMAHYRTHKRGIT